MNENGTVRHAYKLVLKDVPCSIDKEVLQLKFESIYFCGENNEILNITEKKITTSLGQTSRLVIIEYKNRDG